MKLEVRVPISPREHFFRRVEFLDRSLRRCGGVTGQARLVVSVGEDTEPFDLAATQKWTHDLVSWRWVDRTAFRGLSYHATGMDRLKLETDADVVLLMDADTIFVSGIDDLLESLVKVQAIAGVMAHAPPGGPVDWYGLFDAVNISVPQDWHQYSGWGAMVTDPQSRFSPIYYNYGVVFIPGKLVNAIGSVSDQLIGHRSVAGFNFMREQVSLTLAICKLNIPHVTLPIRYNFPNDKRFENLYSDELKHIHILHYLRHDIIDRERDFSTEMAFSNLIERIDLTGANEVLRSIVAKLAAPSEYSRSEADTLQKQFREGLLTGR